MFGCSGQGCLDVKRMFKCRKWRKSAEDSDAWRRRIEEAWRRRIEDAWRRRIEEAWRRRIECDKVEKILDVPKLCST